jgi:hypothetical protein
MGCNIQLKHYIELISCQTRKSDKIKQCGAYNKCYIEK